MRLFVVALVVCFGACAGCGRGEQGISSPDAARQIFGDPRQVRLAEAVKSGNREEIREALRLGADIDAPGRGGIRMLMWAMITKSVEGFEALLDYDANLMARHFIPEVMHPGQRTHAVADLVCVYEDKRFLDIMLARGFNPNRVVDYHTGDTMLFYAVMRHDFEAVSRLVDAGANVNYRNEYDQTPLALAVSVGDHRIAMYLYSHDGDPLVKCTAGFDLIADLKLHGSRGVAPEQIPYFESFVTALADRGLLTWQDIIEADKPKTDSEDAGLPGTTVIEHAPDSEMGQAILQMERSEREANERNGQ